MANKFHNGMLTGRKIFFHNVKKSSSIDKIKRIFKRLEAEIVEIYDGDNINMVIYDEISHSINSTERKRKNNSPPGFQPKRQRLNACIQNILLKNKISESNENPNNNIKRSDSTLSQFLSIAKEKGSKIKSTNEVWQWLSKYYKWLVENDEPDEPIDRNSNLDDYHRVKYLSLSALKICDPFGDTQPLVWENYAIEKSMCVELINEENEVPYELNRKSTGTSKKMKKSMNETSGYCENCREYYQYLCQHMNTNKHTSFAENNANFREIDNFIAQSSAVFDFFLLRQSLWDRHKKSKLSLISLPSSLKQISIHENPGNSLQVKPRQPSPKQINVESNSSSTSSSSDTDSTYSSSESSTESDSSSAESKNNIKIKKNFVSSTPINKIQKPNFFSPDSISTEEQQQSQISSHVNDIIENLDFQLLKNDEEIYPQLNRLLRSNLPQGSPIISRRFDWCKECKRNHVPIDDIDNYQCKLSPLKIENCINSVKSMSFAVDIDETDNDVETDRKSSSNYEEAVFIKLNNNFSKNLVLSNENIIDLNTEIDSININNTKSIDHSSHLDKIDIEKVQKQEFIDENGKMSNEVIVYDCSKISVIASRIDTENNSQVIKKELNESILHDPNDKIEYLSTQVEIQHENNLKLDTVVDTMESVNEFNSSSAPADIVFIPCSVSLERIKYQDEENVLTKSTDEINCHRGLELSEEHNALHRSIQAGIHICSKSQLSNPDSFGSISDQDYSGSYYSEHISQPNNRKSNSKNLSIRKSRKNLQLRGDLDVNSPISGKRKAAIAANRGIENANRFFDKDIRKTIKTLQDTYEPFVYDPREILNKLNYSPNSSNGDPKKLLKERNV